MADQRETDRLSEVVAIGLNAIDNTVSTESRPGAIMEESVYNRTLRAFSRHRSAPGPSQRKKRGKIPKGLTFHLFLLAKSSEFLPPTTELDRLTRNGLGSPKHELPGLLETVTKKTSIDLSKTITDLEDLIISCYQRVPLGQIGFLLGRVNEGKRLEEIKPASLTNLKDILKKGKLWNSPASNINRDETISMNQYDTEIMNSDDNEPSTSLTSRQSTNVLMEPSRSATTETMSEAPVNEDNPLPSLASQRRPASRRTGCLGRTTRRAAARCRTNISNYAATYHRLPAGDGNAARSNLPLPMR
ncbi:unnamed protein product [Mytilus edulis]|uniref:Uncharacterized protein n=1 Tax=Mytilus edulis TaxID=6550 RepID=A0A8S3SV58_MYTED|nr:unnamed protein product [Mytilus edulis]